MKKILPVFACTLLLCNIFLSCSSGDDSGDDNSGKKEESVKETTKTDEQKDSKSETTSVNIPKIKFDFSNAQALARLESAPSSSRAVTDANNLGDFVKILADGSMENAITVAEGSRLSDIVAVYKSPIKNSNDVFVVFKDVSGLGYDYKLQKSLSLGQLVCVHADGSVADVLCVESEKNGYKYIRLKTDSVQFDVNGNLYFVSEANSWNSYDLNGEQAKGEMIYQFKPATNEITLMVAAVENTKYEKLQIDRAGEYIFVYGKRSNTNFLRAIPIANPNAFVNIFYSSNEGIDYDRWVYEETSGVMYYIAMDGNNTGLFTATKAGGFKDKKLQRRYIGDGIDCEILDSFEKKYESFYWTSYLTDGKFDAQEAVKSILNNAYTQYITDYSSGSSKSLYLKLTSELVDIRFDLYSKESGELHCLAVLASGKKNAEAFNALDTNLGRAALYDMGWNIDRFKEKSSGGTKYYENNFFADILYEKDSDTLLKDSNKVLFSYTDSDGKVHEIKGKDIFKKNSYGYESNSTLWALDNSRDYKETSFTFAFAPKFYKKNVLDSSALLNYLFSLCKVEGSKEFRLTSFKDDAVYGALYSDLTNEAALEWLASDAERMNLLGKFVNCHAFCLRNENDRSEKDIGYPSVMNFLAKTCFITGSEEKAVFWNDNTLSLICYFTCNLKDGFFINSSDGEKYKSIGGIRNLTVNEKGVFGICSDFGSKNGPYYYIIQIADTKGNLVEMQNRLPLPNGKVVKSQTDTERLLLQYSLLNSSGGELGYHHIYAVDFDSGNVKNCFENVPNRNGLEVVTFNAAGDMLYYSAVRGTAVENGIVNIATGEYNPLALTRKMVAVYTFQ